MCERCDAPPEALEDREMTMQRNDLPLGEAGYPIGIFGLLVLLGIIFKNAVGL
jgi:hypothetical protein